jgi:hypothetical protein
MGTQNQAPAQNPLAMLKEVLEAAREVKATARELGEGDEPRGDPSDPMTMLPTVLGLVKDAMAQRQQAPIEIAPISFPPSLANAQASVHAHPMPLPQSLPQSQSQSMPLHEAMQVESTIKQVPSMQELILRGSIDKLLSMAENNAPIDSAAEYVADEFPEELLPYLNLPNWFDIICHITPKLREHEKWLRDVKAAADVLLSDPGEGVSESKA